MIRPTRILALTKCWLPWISAFAALVSGDALAAPSLPVNRQVFGVNAAGFSDYSATKPFNDLMKQSRPWIYDFEKDSAKPETDALGNWKPQPGKQPFAVLAGPLSRCPAGLYIVTWEGKGKVASNKLSKGTVRKEEANRLEVEYQDSPNITLQIAASDPADPVRNLHCFLPGTEHDPGHFNKGYYGPYHGMFSTVRFMDWMHTNGSEQEKWANRPTPDTQSFRGQSGVPVEYLVEFANLVHVNPWFCMPHMADDEYIRNFARVVKEKLDPSLKVYIEYSNEIWNTAPGFKQTAWATAKSQELGLPSNARAPFAPWYAKRSIEIFKVWEEVFGGRERLVRVAAGFAISSTVNQAKLEAFDLGKNCDAFAIAPYVGFNADVGKDLNTANLNPGVVIRSTQEQIDDKMAKTVAAASALAKSHKLRLIAYESGINYTAPQKLRDDPTVLSCIVNTGHDPAMEACMEKYLRKWYSLTGDLMCLFSDYNAPGKYGTYGNLGEYPGQPVAEVPRLRAILRLMQDPGLAPAKR